MLKKIVYWLVESTEYLRKYFNSDYEYSDDLNIKPNDYMTVRTTQISFYKDGGRWYADVPSRSKDDNEMVYHADEMLEIMSNGKNNVDLYVLTYQNSNEVHKPVSYLLELTRAEHDSDGAYYHVTSYGLSFNLFADKLPNKIWLCNVVHDVFVEHPEIMYVVDLNYK